MTSNPTRVGLFLGILLPLVSCSAGDPLAKDEAPNEPTSGAAASLTSPTYYTFSVGHGLTGADLSKDCYSASASFHCLLYPVNVNGVWKNIITAPYGSFLEATYSSRLAGAPETMWVPNGDWLQSGALLDNEQVEQHFIVTDHVWPGSQNQFASYTISLSYEVSSEPNFDYLWINSTASDTCNSPGVVRKKVSGQESGQVSFMVQRSCGTIWLGVYYIKDGSVSLNGDFGRIKDLRIEPAYPVGVN